MPLIENVLFSQTFYFKLIFTRNLFDSNKKFYLFLKNKNNNNQRTHSFLISNFQNNVQKLNPQKKNCHNHLLTIENIFFATVITAFLIRLSLSHLKATQTLNFLYF